MSEYLEKIDKLRTKINESHENFKKVLMLYPTLTKEAHRNIENILEVSGRYISALNTFLNSKSEDFEVTNEEKVKLKGIFDYYEGMNKILKYYDIK